MSDIEKQRNKLEDVAINNCKAKYEYAIKRMDGIEQ